MDLRRIDTLLGKHCRMEKSSPLVVGVSGGPDSVCLLDILSRLGYSLVVAHFDHQIRPESGEDAEFVRRAAARYNLPFEVGTENIPALAKKKQVSIEAAARQARYNYLFDCARRWNAQAVAVAHTADDQVETVLMHLLRGSGLDGLTGMDFSSTLPEWGGGMPLVRPLLSTWRNEVEQYCQEQGLSARTDTTNLDIHYTRNRIRLELIPQLETYNPQARKALWRLADNMRIESSILLPIQETAWQSCVLDVGEDRVLLDCISLRAMQAGLQRWVVRKALKFIPLGDELDQGLVERVLRFIETPTRSRQVELAGGFVCRMLRGNRLLFCQAGYSPNRGGYPGIPVGSEMKLVFPGVLAVESGWSLHMELIQAELRSWVPDEEWKIYLDADRVAGDLRLRTCQPGDRYSPMGMGRKSTKLSDLFINNQLPKEARSALPLVCDSQGIVWVPGAPPAERVKITPMTMQVLVLQWVKDR